MTLYLLIIHSFLSSQKYLVKCLKVICAYIENMETADKEKQTKIIQIVQMESLRSETVLTFWCFAFQ